MKNSKKTEPFSIFQTQPNNGKNLEGDEDGHEIDDDDDTDNLDGENLTVDYHSDL